LNVNLWYKRYKIGRFFQDFHTLWKLEASEEQILKVFEKEAKSANFVPVAYVHGELARAWGDVAIEATSVIGTNGTQFSRFTTRNMGTLQSSKNCWKNGEMRPESPS